MFDAHQSLYRLQDDSGYDFLFFTHTIFLGSKVTEVIHLIGKNRDGIKLEPENALVYLMYTLLEDFFAGGALLSNTCVITPAINVIRFIRKELSILNLRVGIGARNFDRSCAECHHFVERIEQGSDCNEEEAIAFIILKPLPNLYGILRPRVQPIPLADHSYTPGQHTVSESFIAWNEVRNHNCSHRK